LSKAEEHQQTPGLSSCIVFVSSPSLFATVRFAILVTGLVALSGCAGLAVRLGLRTRLETVPVSSVSAGLVSEHDHTPVNALGPGQSAALVIVATDPKGEKFVTAGAGGGKVLFDSYLIDASIVTVNNHGRVSLPADPSLSEGKEGRLRITLVGHPGVTTELDIPVRYDIAYRANFSGADGMNGMDGLAGLDGSAGMDAPLPMADPATGLPGTQGPGGRGSDGSRGGDGSNGQDGSPGLDVHIWIRLAAAAGDASAANPLLQVKVSGGARQSLFLIDPHGGSLRVSADGGQGGRGGAGGRGGRGGSAGNGFPPGLSGLDGPPGADGRSGSSGAGGRITVSVDLAAQPYLSTLSWSNRSGDGRAGPAPNVVIEPISNLW
jgi:hypothetical protein